MSPVLEAHYFCTRKGCKCCSLHYRFDIETSLCKKCGLPRGIDGTLRLWFVGLGLFRQATPRCSIAATSPPRPHPLFAGEHRLVVTQVSNPIKKFGFLGAGKVACGSEVSEMSRSGLRVLDKAMEKLRTEVLDRSAGKFVWAT